MTAILLTGASSFTGLWIAERLAAEGYLVRAPLPRPLDAYAGVRLERVRRLQAIADVRFGAPFGSITFLELLSDAAGHQVLALHGAQVAGFRDPGFDALAAFASNVAGAREVLRSFRDRGGARVILTGSVFEAGEGEFSDGGAGPHARAVTDYGLSKTLTRLTLDHWAAAAGLRFDRFVIPSPYGPWEERRFGWSLFRAWMADETPVVRTPDYVRDHLTAPQVAAAYLNLLRAEQPTVARPSGWIAPQGVLAQRTALEAGRRLGRDLPLELKVQADFSEPLRRVNTEPVGAAPADETRFWDAYVDWYVRLKSEGLLDKP